MPPCSRPTPPRALRVGAALLAASTLALFAACAPEPPAASDTATFTGTGGHGTTSTGKGAADAGAGGDDSFFDGGTTPNDAALGADAACAATANEAELVAVNMFIMFDKSGSMKDDNKWANTTGALASFFGDPASAGLRVGLRFFPDTGCDSSTCSIAKCATPQVVPAPLTADASPTDAQEKKLLDAIASKGPGGDTPMSAALGGAEKWATDWVAAHPTEKAVVILVTDGEPNGCNNDIAAIAKQAEDAHALGVYTYAIGLVGSNEAQMDQIAKAGGAAKAFLVGNDNASAELLAALKAIQGTAVACEFKMPASDNGKPVDPTKVNVDYVPGDGGKPVSFVQVAGVGDCGDKQAAWYYDDPKSPTKITLCPATCAAVQADEKAKVEVLLGCATETVK